MSRRKSADEFWDVRQDVQDSVKAAMIVLGIEMVEVDDDDNESKWRCSEGSLSNVWEQRYTR
jgi:hypothetical protein